MRCKKHLCDVSSSVGVCASCLRERLLALIAAQAQVQAQQHHPAQLSRPLSRAEDTHHHHHQQQQQRNSTDSQHPPPLLFPRSVSPYVTRRKSDDNTSSWSHHQLRFYSTPQVGPTYSTTTAFASSRSCKKKLGKFSLLSNLFRSGSEKLNPDHNATSDHRVCPRDSCDTTASAPSSSSTPSWFSTIFSGRRRKKKPDQFSTEYSETIRRKPSQMSDRGMSPARESNSEEDCDRSPSVSGCSSEESRQGWKRTPVSHYATATRRGRASGHSRNVSSGLAFCLSPLVRASPNRHWNQKCGGLPPDLGFSGEVRVQVKPHLSTAASFCANRSRKLVDFGRVNHNR